MKRFITTGRVILSTLLLPVLGKIVYARIRHTEVFPRFQLANWANFDSDVAEPEFDCLFDGYERCYRNSRHGWLNDSFPLKNAVWEFIV